MMMKTPVLKAPETQAIHAWDGHDDQSGDISVPIHMAATFKLPGFGIKLFEALNLESEKAAHVYSRWSNPTLRVLEGRLAALEGAESGLVFSTGMAAISALLFTFLSSGDHVVANHVCYAGAAELLGSHLPRFGVQVSLVDTSDLSQVQAAMRANTRLVYVETPSNPILKIADIRAIAQIAHQSGALLAVDSTFASPLLQRPLDLGADYVVHSLTKYINGHADALGGAILGPRVGIARIRKEMLVHLGGALSPFNAWLILRGLETLPVRMAQHSQNALTVAQFLESHPAVQRVYYPGLASHPQYELAGQQMSAGGGMLALRLKGGLGAAITLAEKIKVWTYATSLGHPASLLFYYPTDLYVDAAPYLSLEQKASLRAWVGEGILRASVGLENVNDLIADLDQALCARTFKGLVGPLAYRLMKAKS
jgi:cystathionine beta-lyase/cystathionine gamma-synthase